MVFCIGFAAAAFSSFLVNAMIGGTLLADGLGLGDDLNGRAARLGSALSLVIGMVVALLVTVWRTIDFAQTLVAAQAGTLLAIPLAIVSVLVVLLRPGTSGVRRLRIPAVVFVLVGTAVLVAMAALSFTTTLDALRRMLGGGP